MAGLCEAMAGISFLARLVHPIAAWNMRGHLRARMPPRPWMDRTHYAGTRAHGEQQHRCTGSSSGGGLVPIHRRLPTLRPTPKLNRYLPPRHTPSSHACSSTARPPPPVPPAMAHRQRRRGRLAQSSLCSPHRRRSSRRRSHSTRRCRRPRQALTQAEPLLTSEPHGLGLRSSASARMGPAGRPCRGGAARAEALLLRSGCGGPPGVFASMPSKAKQCAAICVRMPASCRARNVYATASDQT